MTREYKEWLLGRLKTHGDFNAHTGLRVVDVDDGVAVVKLEQKPVVLNRWGVPHGGALFTMGDVAAGVAALTVRPERMLTLNASVDFMDAAAPGGALTAVGRVERIGGRVCFCRVEITDCAGKKIAAMRATVYFTGEKLELE